MQLFYTHTHKFILSGSPDPPRPVNWSRSAENTDRRFAPDGPSGCAAAAAAAARAAA
jgi:hypothetical protein